MKKLYQLMHKYGKLTSCDSDNPHTIDIMFMEELKGVFKNE